MSKFKVGDKVIFSVGSTVFRTEIVSAEKRRGESVYACYWRSGDEGCNTVSSLWWHDSDFTLIEDAEPKSLTNSKETTIMGNIVNKIKELALDTNTKLFLKHGIIDESRNLTEDGKQVLTDFLFDLYTPELVEKVKEIEAAEKAEKKGK